MNKEKSFAALGGPLTRNNTQQTTKDKRWIEHVQMSREDVMTFDDVSPSCTVSSIPIFPPRGPVKERRQLLCRN
jgi:hypothetical protein